MTQPVTVEIRDGLDHAVVTVTGELVEAAAALVHRAVEVACAMYSRLVVNVEGVTILDNVGLWELLRVRDAVADRNGSVEIIGLGAAARRRPYVPAQRVNAMAATGEVLARIDSVLTEDGDAGGRDRPAGNADQAAGLGDESVALEQVAARLHRRFPLAEAAMVDKLVATFNEQYDGRPIRDFVPVLVEREATEVLRALTPPREQPLST